MGSNTSDDDGDDSLTQSTPETASMPSSPSQSPHRSPVTKQSSPASLSHHIAPNSEKKNQKSGGGREDCWSEEASAALIDAWGERYLQLNRGNLNQKHWKDVADAVNSRRLFKKSPKTDVQCKNRIDTLKKKYKIEKAKIAAGSLHSTWPFFHKLDQLIGQTKKIESAIGKNRIRIRAEPLALPPPEVAAQLPESSDSLPPVMVNEKKRKRVDDHLARNATGRVDDSMSELTRALVKFGEVYEKIELSKLNMETEMEQQRLEFMRKIELQRMEFFIKTQLEFRQLKHGLMGNGKNRND